MVYIFNEETIHKLNILLTILKKYLDNRIYRINVICFSENRHNDENYYYRYLDKEQNVNLVTYSDNIDKIISTFMSQDLMISMRYHSMLLSLSLGIPSINIMYDTHKHYTNKVTYVMEQFGVNVDKCIKFSELKDEMEEIKSKIVMNQNDKAWELLHSSQEQLCNLVKEM